MTATKSAESDVYIADVHRGNEFVVIGDPASIHAQNFSSLLTGDILLELGEADVSWFTCKSPSIQMSSSLSNDDLVGDNMDGDHFTQDSRCNPLAMAVSPVLSQSVQFKEWSDQIEHECLMTPPNVGINKSLKTPHFYGISPIFQSAGCSNLRHSTPGHLTSSLGATMGGHDLSWTSSMATPCLSKSTDTSAKKNSRSDNNHSVIDKEAVSTMLFDSKLPLANSEADNCGNENKVDSRMGRHFGNEESSEEFCSRLESTRSEEFYSRLGSFATPDMGTKTINKRPIRRPSSMHTNVQGFPDERSHSAHVNERLLEEKPTYVKSVIQSLCTSAQIPSCDKEDTPKRPKQNNKHNARKVLLELPADTSDCAKEGCVSPSLPTKCFPHHSSEESISIFRSNKNVHDRTHRENIKRGTTVSISAVVDPTIPSECDVKEKDISCVLKMNVQDSPGGVMPCESLVNDANIRDIANDLGDSKCINRDSTASLENDFCLISSQVAFIEKNNLKLNAVQCESPACDSVQKEYVQLENMSVIEPVFMEEADPCPVELTTAKGFLPSDVALPLAPCAVKVDSGATESVNINIKSITVEDKFKQIGDRVVGTKLPQEVQKNTLEPLHSNHSIRAKFDGNCEQDASNILTSNLHAKIKNIEKTSPKLASLVLDEDVPEIPRDSSGTNLVGEVFNDQDDDIFLNISSYDCRTKLRIAEEKDAEWRAPEMGDIKLRQHSCSPENMLEPHVESNKLAQTRTNLFSLGNAEARSQKEFKGFATAGGQTIVVSAAALEKAEKLFKEDEWVCKSEIQPMNKEKKTSAMSSSFFDTKSASVIECGANLERLSALKMAKNMSEDDGLPLVSDSEHQLALTHAQIKPPSACKPETNMKSDGSGEHHSDSRIALKKMFDENLSPVIVSKHNALENEAYAKEAVFTIQTSAGPDAFATMKTFPQVDCSGFSTASGKPLSVSKTALKNATSVFKDDDLLQLCKSEFINFEVSTDEKKTAPDCLNSRSSEIKNPVPIVCQGFSTASGKPVLMSKSTLDKAKRLFFDDELLQAGECDDSHVMVQCKMGRSSSHPSNSDACIPPNDNNGENESFVKGVPKLTKEKKIAAVGGCGFSTASGKAMLLSKTALERAQSIFKEDGLSQLHATELHMIPASPIEKGKLTREGEAFDSNKYFTPSNKNMKQTEFSKQKCTNAKRNMLVQLHGASSATFESASNADFPSFSLASGRQIHISKTALEKATSLFFEESLPKAQPLTNTKNCAGHVTSNSNGSLANVPAVISEHSTLKEDFYPNDSFENLLLNVEEFDNKSKAIDNVANNFHGFFTANGNRVSVSTEALQQAQAILNSNTCSSASSQDCNNSQQFAVVPEPKSGLADSPIESASKLTNISDIQAVPLQIAPTSDPLKKRSFATIDKCDQNIPKRMRCSTPLSKDNVAASVSDPPEPSEKRISCGFAFASGKNVAVSEESLRTARDMFADSERQESGLQVVPLCPHGSDRGKITDDWSTLSEEFSHDMLDEDETISIEKNHGVHSVPELSSNGIGDMSNNGHLSVIHNEQLSTEIMESTVALLADEMTCTPVKGEKRSSSWLSPIQGRPKKLFSCDDTCDSYIGRSKKSVPDTDSKAVDNFSVIDTPSADLKKCYWRSVPSKSVPIEIQQIRRLAIEEQLMSIQKRKRGKVSPVPGLLWQKKLLKDNKVSLNNIVKGKLPKRVCPNEAMMHGVKMSTLKIQSVNAGEYQFLWEEHYNDAALDSPGVTLGDVSLLIFDDENLAGKKEFYRALLNMPGVDSKLIDESWAYNHYRWIVWKLAAMEVSFPALFGGRLLTPEQVMWRLHYRYNREIDFSHRSALKKIMERDDTPAKTMVLCVVDIDKQMLTFDDSTLLDASIVSDAKSLEVTDGWYSIRAVIDSPLIRLVKSGQICIGQKLIVHGAELIGPAEACAPLEAPNNLALKLSANCVRRAKWNAKLGYFASPKPFPLPLMSFYSDGGLVGCIHIVVARIYPIQYLEKRDDGTMTVYNERMNGKAARQFENKKSILMEKIFIDVQDKFNREETKRVSWHSVGKTNTSSDDIKELVNGDEIFKVLENNADPSSIENCLSGTQRTALTHYKETLLENQRAKFESEIEKAMNDGNEKCSVVRNVIPFLKFRAVGTLPKDLHKHTGCLVTLWRPAPDVYNMLKEGKAICAYYLLAESRSSMHQKELHLKSTKMTKLEEKIQPNDILSRILNPRNLTSLDSIGITGFSPQFGEVDIIGLIVHIGYQQQSKFDFLYLADIHLNIAVIKFWGGLKTFGLETFLLSGTFVLASNIQWRGKIASCDWNYLYATEYSTFSQNPKDQTYQTAFKQFKDSFENATSFVDKAKEKISRMTNLRVNSTITKQLYLGKPSSSSTPLSHSSGKNTCMDTPPTSVTPVQQRLKQLGKYGAPPSLPNLISNNSSLLKSRFRTPTFVTNPEQIEAHHTKIVPNEKC